MSEKVTKMIQGAAHSRVVRDSQDDVNRLKRSVIIHRQEHVDAGEYDNAGEFCA